MRVLGIDDGLGQWVVPCDAEVLIAFNFGLVLSVANYTRMGID